MINSHSQMNIEEERLQQAQHQQQHQQQQQGNIDIHTYIKYIETHKKNRTEDAFDVYYLANLPAFFGIWKENVCNLILINLGISVLDIPDFAYYDSFIEGIMPHQMAQYIENNLP